MSVEVHEHEMCGMVELLYMLELLMYIFQW